MANSVRTGFKMGMKATVAIGALAMAAAQAHAQEASGQGTAPQKHNSKKAAEENLDAAAEIVVTGTRIPGASTASPAYEITQAQMLAAGQHDLGEAIRSLPFNFNGGQNPTVTTGAGITNQNITNGSSANLRGLGPDATLTLLNGRRLAYGGFTQGVDISTIPLAAVSSLQIVPDGSSAIYGSDAVGGVVNVILKPDFDGLETSARIDVPTEGGGFHQQYDGTAGARWANGGFLVAGQYQHQNPIDSTQRQYTSYMPTPADLYARSREYNALVTAHQDLGEDINLRIDATYSDRTSFKRYSPTSATSRSDYQVHTKNYVISPSITVHLPANWTSTLSGTYGSSNSYERSGTTTIATGETRYSRSCDCNDLTAVELSAEGPLFEIGGGPARLAIGGGYRENGFDSISYTSAFDEGGRRHSFYAYGEINLPIVSEVNARPGVQKLALSGAGRFEHYNDFGEITTPKVGIIYSPISGVDIKGTWGRSFKAPTLLQQFQESDLYVYPAAWMGATNLPDTAAVLMPYGGNPNLTAERSENWSATLELHPTSIPGFQMSLSYFNVAYRGRIIQPLSIGTALSNPVYAPFIIYDPSDEQKSELVNNSPNFYNYSPVDYDPANIIAITENRYINAASQNIEGVDFNANYSFPWGSGQMTLLGQASWLRSRQRTSEGLPETSLAGYIFNPPTFRGRGGATWQTESFGAATFLNYIGGVKDDRSGMIVQGDPMVTIDFSLNAKFRSGLTADRDIRVSLNILNVADGKPPYLKPNAPSLVNYDSTNYSPMGRVLSFSISKTW